MDPWTLLKTLFYRNSYQKYSSLMVIEPTCLLSMLEKTATVTFISEVPSVSEAQILQKLVTDSHAYECILWLKKDCTFLVTISLNYEIMLM